MGSSSEMTIRVVELPCERSFALPVAFVRGAIEGLPLRAALGADPEDPDAGEAFTEVSLYEEGENVFVRGTLRGWLEVACSRCVGRARVAVDEALQVTYMPTAAIPEETEREVDLEEDDLELYPFDGESIDLQPLLRDQLVLSVPFAPVCDEACRGLCPECGGDLNNVDCGCEREVIDPRLAALKNIKL